MKLPQLRKLVKQWQTKLSLKAWSIQTKWANETTTIVEGMTGADAWVEYDENVLEATIWFPRKDPVTPFEELVIHELLHLHLWPIEDKVRQEQAVEAIVKVLKPRPK